MQLREARQYNPSEHQLAGRIVDKDN